MQTKSPPRRDDNPQAMAQRRAQQANKRAKRRAFWQHFGGGLFNFNLQEFVSFLRTATKWLTLGTVVGILAGIASAIFLISLAWATEVRMDNPALLVLLPLAGFVAGWFYWRFGGAANQGNNLVIDEVNNNRSRIPLRMAPFVLGGTVITHLFGGSAGREGTAIQMGASLADTMQRLLRLNPTDRRLMIMAGIAGGFGSVFGVPAAGFVFGMEVQSVGRIRYEGIIPCIVASFVGDYVTRAIGAEHSHYPTMAQQGIEPVLVIKVALAGIAFGLTSMLFIELVHGIKHGLQRLTRWTPLYPVLGGSTIIGLTLLVGTTDYLGLSLSLIQNSVNGTGVVAFAFLLKLIFTTVTLGSGYYGGEVTPLLVIGATLGYTMGRLLGIDPAFMASIGLVSVFAGASNTPLASAIMGIELVGGGAPLYLFLGCTVAYLASGHRGIYMTQSVIIPKSSGFAVQEGDNLRDIALRQRELNARPIHTIMSRHPVTVYETTPLSTIIEIAMREGVRTIPVLNMHRIVVGVITDTDIQKVGINSTLTLLQQLTVQERLAVIKGQEQVQASTIMTTNLVTALPTDTISTAIERMTEHHLKRLPVVDQRGHLKGMVTRSDILRDILATSTAGQETELNWQATLEDVVLEPVYTVESDRSVQEVVQLMLEKNARRIPVVDDGKLVGIVSQRDLLERMKNDERPRFLQLLRHEISLNDVRFSQGVTAVMTAPVIAVDVQTYAYVALQYLIENQIKRLPVIDSNGEVQGMIGRAGLMYILFNHESSVPY